MTNSFGLRPSDIEIIIAVLRGFPQVSEAMIFGSRAKGNYRNGSDVDIAIKGDVVSFQDVSDISCQLNEETTLPYKFDVLNYHTISSAELREHIDRVSICFYKIQS